MNILPDERAKLDGTPINLLVYADDRVLLRNNINTMKSLCVRLIEAAKKWAWKLMKGKQNKIWKLKKRTEEFS